MGRIISKGQLSLRKSLISQRIPFLLAVIIGRCNLISSFGLTSWDASRRTSLLNLAPQRDNNDGSVYMEAVAMAGVQVEEVPHLMNAVSNACSEFGLPFNDENVAHETAKAQLEGMCGTTGRVLLLSLNNVDDSWTRSDDRLNPIQSLISEHLDELLYGTGDTKPAIHQPVLVCIRPSYGLLPKDIILPIVLGKIANEEVNQYDLCKPLSNDSSKELQTSVGPHIHVEIDGDMVVNPFNGEETWDTSSIFVLDNLIDRNLREGLLDVVLERNSVDPSKTTWNDITDGPDPDRWVLGGLDDVPEIEDGQGGAPSCWGLREEAIADLCFGSHDAIIEFEKKLVALFPDFVVTRLPEAVLGACVSPLTANAPTVNDSFSYHIDADPNVAPPSPWTDVFGRYINRCVGKPRFLSCLVYLNDIWDESFGAPTRFLDPPTQEVYEVFPRPGRVVLMDQDITHTVVAPNEAAGNRPRYSLVWKLVLHPRKEDQDMRNPFQKSLDCRKIKIGSSSRKM